MSNLEKGTPEVPETIRIEIDARGPYLLFGNIPIRQQFIIPDHEGNSRTFRSGATDYNTGKEPVALCRCGHSANKPYCDGAHIKASWDPRLTASHHPLLDDAEVIDGPTLQLSDNPTYCAFARFCDAKGRTWNQVTESDDPSRRELTIRTANHCPAGRLKAWDKHTGEPFEPELKPQIGLLEDPSIRVSGGLWVMGGVTIRDPQGVPYQVRNRVTLCRCGESYNKPFCDGTHVSSKFRDRLANTFGSEEF